MKSYPSSELRNMCDEHVTSEEPAEKEDLLQQMLERRCAQLLPPRGHRWPSGFREGQPLARVAAGSS